MDFEAQQDEEEEQQENDSPQPPNRIPSPVEVTAAPLRKTRYRECLKNHAMGVGGQAVDGCGEFLAAGPEGTLEHFKCAACGCHRNFHRRENEPGSAFAFHQQQQHHHHHQQHLLLTHHSQYGHVGFRGPTGYVQVVPPQQQRAAQPLALPSSSGGGGGSGSRDEMEDYYSNPSSSAGKKRSRTKFSQEQKDKMLNFAERLGWKIQKNDEVSVQQFCNEIGIKRQVLKVWMHNNKHTLGKKT